MKFKVKLRLTDSSGVRKKYSINLEDGVKFMIGRGTPGLGSDLGHPSVSSQHCFLSVKDHLVWVTDNQSRNGTFLNQKRIDSVSVRVGDMLQIGDYVIEFLEAPMPAVKKDNASTQFIDIAELSAEEQEALKRAGAVQDRPREATQVMSRSTLFNRSKSIDVPKLKAEAEAEAAAKAATAPPALPVKDTVPGELTPMSDTFSSSPASDGVTRASSSIDLAALESESAAAPATPAEVAAAATPVALDMNPVSGITVEEESDGDSLGERKTDEIDRPTQSESPPAKPADLPETLMPPELMPTGMTYATRGYNNKIEAAQKIESPQKPALQKFELPKIESPAVTEKKVDTDSFLDSPKVVTKSEISAPFTRPVEPDSNPSLNPVLPPEVPKQPSSSSIPRLSSIPPAPAPSRRKDDEPDTGSSVAAAAEDERKKQLVNKHLKKPSPETPPPAPISKKGRVNDRPVEDQVAARVGPLQGTGISRSATFSPHTLVSFLVAFTSFAACGGAVASMAGAQFHLWIPPAYGLVGAVMVAGLAWLLNHYNEFMEADGELRDYHRLLALASIPVVFLGALSHASALYRLPAYVLYGVIFFNVFMSRFKPLAERFLFLAGSYVASFAFVVYVATSWDTIVNSAMQPQDVATNSDSATPAARTPAEAVHPVPDTKPAPVQEQAAQNQAPVPDTGAAASNSGAAAASNSGNGGVTAAAQSPVSAPTQASQPQPDSFAMSELLTAAQQGDQHIVHGLITDKGVNPNTAADNGMTALMYAAYNGHIPVAKELVTAKADVNMRDRQGTTALMWAAYNGKQDMTAYLIQAGADLNSRRNDGDTALDIAKRWDRAEVVRYLENPALARAAHPGETVAAKPAPPQTVRVTTPPAHRVASRHSTSHRAPAGSKSRRPSKKVSKSRDKYSATTSEDSNDDDDSDARARAVKSLKIGQ